MTKKIGNAILIKRLANRFALTELEPEVLQLSETIVPVTSADNAMKKLKEYTKTIAISAAGYQEIIRCPEGKRQEIVAAYGTVSSGTFTLSRLNMVAPSGSVLPMKAQSGGTFVYWQPTNPTYLDKSWSLSILVDTYTGAGNLGTIVYVLESDGENE